MSQAKTILKRSLIVLVVMAQMSLVPLHAYATEETASDADTAASSEQAATPADPTPEAPTPPAPAAPTPPAPSTGPSQPTGADSTTYTYNPATGMWENDYYSWNPTTHQTTPKQSTTYSYNPATGKWDTTEWRYDAPSGKYVPNVVSSSAAKPAGANAANTLAAGTGPGSSNTSDGTSNNSADVDVFNTATLNNMLNGCANSGDASVNSNTIAGGATSGNSASMANVLNMLGSSWGNLGQDVATFNANIDGNVVGDLYINPMNVNPMVNNTGPNSNQHISHTNNNDLDVNVSDNGSIHNNIDLCANSGKATVSSNTNAGDATSGNADAVANVLNLINSSISAGQSFVGTLNINGSLDGDILLPEGVLNQLLAAASDTAPLATVNTSQIENSQLLANFTNTNSIENNVDAGATSGQATVTNNKTAGDASTGAADTNVTLLNLTGRDVIGNNGLLVFINVLGTWVGVIMDAPAGTHAAALGGGISGNNTVDTTTDNSTDINVNENKGIKNDITVKANSGDASVDQNTNAGNAKTGKATASVNLLNLINSKLNLSDWFGVLFINVFGSWNGSFGVNTDAGNARALAAIASGQLPVQGVQTFAFSPSTQQDGGITLAADPSLSSGAGTIQDQSTSSQPASAVTMKAGPAPSKPTLKNTTASILGVGGMITASFLGIDQASSLRERRARSKSKRQSINISK